MASPPAKDSQRFKTRLMSVYAAREDYDARKYRTVVFEVSPEISISRTAEYVQLNPIHLPGTIFVYKNTNSRTFSLSAKFVSRTPEEAETNLRYRQLLQSWQMPYFGDGSRKYNTTNNIRGNSNTAENQIRSAQRGTTSNQSASNNTGGWKDESVFLGAPPEVLYFYAYADASQPDQDRRQFKGSGVNVQRIPVVLTDFNFSLPTEVDYIPTLTDKIPFPIIYTATITLMETHSPNDFQSFSLNDYRAGRLPGF